MIKHVLACLVAFTFFKSLSVAWAADSGATAESEMNAVLYDEATLVQPLREGETAADRLFTAQTWRERIAKELADLVNSSRVSRSEITSHYRVLSAAGHLPNLKLGDPTPEDEATSVRVAAATNPRVSLAFLIGSLTNLRDRRVVPLVGPLLAETTDGIQDEDSKDGLQARTCAAFLLNPGDCRNAVIICDEAGLQSNADGVALLRKAEAKGARVVFVGDTRQHVSVSAGDFLRVLETHSKLQSVEVSTIERQKVADYKAAVVKLSVGDPIGGLETLDALGWIHVPTRQLNRRSHPGQMLCVLRCRPQRFGGIRAPAQGGSGNDEVVKVYSNPSNNYQFYRSHMDARRGWGNQNIPGTGNGVLSEADPFFDYGRTSQPTAAHEFGHGLGLEHPGEGRVPYGGNPDPYRYRGKDRRGNDVDGNADLMGVGGGLRKFYFQRWADELNNRHNKCNYAIQ